MEWRRNKVRELLTRGYSHYEIANTLHINQPTISDIHYLQREIKKNKLNHGERLFDVLHYCYLCDLIIIYKYLHFCSLSLFKYW